MGKGSVEDYQFLVGTTNFDDEDGLLYVKQNMYIERPPVEAVIPSQQGFDTQEWCTVKQGG